MLYSLLKALFDLASLLSTSLSNLPSDVLVYGLQHSLANGDASKVILFTRCWLVEDFCLFQADLKSEELGSFCEAGCQALQDSFDMFNEGSLVGKEKVSK